jgi:hypothetical protein
LFLLDQNSSSSSSSLPLPPPWTPPPLPSNSLSLLSIPVARILKSFASCCGNGHGLLCSFMQIMFTMPPPCCDAPRQHHGATALHARHPGVPCHLPEPTAAPR